MEFLIEAHSGISARIAEEAGFRGIWASGLAISAQCGLPDNNELTWTELAGVLDFMCDATTLPVLVDGDSGHGNFNNVRRLIRKLEHRGVAGICLEDKQFPKQNSFIESERQALASIPEFCGKIKAAKDSQRDPDFQVVARIEALIAGWSMEVALERADAYRNAGADAILIHSRRAGPEEILEFAARWGERAPLVVVPTTYYATRAEVFERAGVSVVIWANHLLRAAVAAMQATASEIRRARSVAEVEDHIAPLAQIFRLQGAAERVQAERRYLQAQRGPARAIVLAASRGRELEALTAHRPKAMLPIAGSPLLGRLVDQLKSQEVHDVTVVAGYRADTIDIPGLRVVCNRDYEKAGELSSLACAVDELQDLTIVLYGDLLFRGYVLESLIESPAEITIVVDSRVPEPMEGGSRDFAWCSEPDDRTVWQRDVRLIRICDWDGSEPAPCGRWIGLMKIVKGGCEWVNEAVARLRERPGFPALDIPDLLKHLVEMGRPVRVIYIYGHWLDVNRLEDLDPATCFAAERGGPEREERP